MLNDVDLMLELWGTVNPFTLGVAFCFGALLGSFLNVVVYRLPLDRSVVFPASACTTCGTPLKWWMNIPILAYFALGGRCHTCASPYSIRYALVELFIACTTAGLLVHTGGFGWMFLYWFVLTFISVAVFLTDLDHWIIPDQLNLAGVVLGTLGSLVIPPRHDLDWLGWGLSPVVANLMSSLAGIVLGVGFFWGIQVVGLVLARQEAMGGGDVKYAAALGAFLGWQMSFVAFLLSFVLGAAVAFPVLLKGWVTRGRGKGKDPIPFGTFMAVAAVATALWGPELLAEFYRVTGEARYLEMARLFVERRGHGVLDGPLRAVVWREGLRSMVAPAAAGVATRLLVAG